MSKFSSLNKTKGLPRNVDTVLQGLRRKQMGAPISSNEPKARLKNSIGFWILSSIVLGLVGLVSLPEPNVLVSASVNTETLSLNVTRPDSPPVVLSRAIFEFNGNSECVDELVIFPKKDSEVFYTRVGNELSVAIIGTFDWSLEDGRKGVVDDEGFALISSEGDCSQSKFLRLPVSGTANIGTVAGSDSGDDEIPLTLLNGDIYIYGRATDRIFFLPVKLFSWLLPMEPNRLYLADDFIIPPGSNLYSEHAFWGGFVDVSLEDKTRGMVFKASTNARSLNLVAPAPRVSSRSNTTDSQKADVISLTFGAQLNNDPNIKWAFAAVSFFCLILGVFFQLPNSRD